VCVVQWCCFISDCCFRGFLFELSSQSFDHAANQPVKSMCVPAPPGVFLPVKRDFSVKSSDAKRNRASRVLAFAFRAIARIPLAQRVVADLEPKGAPPFARWLRLAHARCVMLRACVMSLCIQNMPLLHCPGLITSLCLMAVLRDEHERWRFL
jgi:hypothetical protein